MFYPVHGSATLYPLAPGLEPLRRIHPIGFSRCSPFGSWGRVAGTCEIIFRTVLRGLRSSLIGHIVCGRPGWLPNAMRRRRAARRRPCAFPCWTTSTLSGPRSCPMAHARDMPCLPLVFYTGAWHNVGLHAAQRLVLDLDDDFCLLSSHVCRASEARSPHPEALCDFMSEVCR